MTVRKLCKGVGVGTIPGILQYRDEYKCCFKIVLLHCKGNKTGTRQCTWAIWSTFADIHSTHPGALMYYLGLLEFPVRICDASHVKTHTRPTHVPNLSHDCDL